MKHETLERLTPIETNLGFSTHPFVLRNNALDDLERPLLGPLFERDIRC